MKGFCSGEAYAGYSFIFLFHLSFSEAWTENRQTALLVLASIYPILSLPDFICPPLHFTVVLFISLMSSPFIFT